MLTKTELKKKKKKSKNKANKQAQTLLGVDITDDVIQRERPLHQHGGRAVGVQTTPRDVVLPRLQALLGRRRRRCLDVVHLVQRFENVVATLVEFAILFYIESDQHDNWLNI